jgi:hypothetical protein
MAIPAPAGDPAAATRVPRGELAETRGPRIDGVC